ncbi:MFS transporter [Kitasatospora sp. Ki12]
MHLSRVCNYCESTLDAHSSTHGRVRAHALALLALAIGAFGIGTTEFVIMGLLPQIAGDYGVSIPDAGLLVTGYALGVVIGAPLMTALGTRSAARRC